MNDIQLFSNDEFGTIRTIEVDGDIMFCGKDVALALGYTNTSKAISDHCRGVPFRYPIQDVMGRTQEARFITEGDLYRLAASSKLESAQRFESWVFDEVIPSIRKHGAYMTPVTIDAIIADPAFGIRLLTELQSERERNRALLQENCKLVPKAQFYDNLMDSDGLLSVRDAAKILKSYDPTIGEKRLRQNLRDDCMVEKRTTKATSVAIERGYMRERPFSFKHNDGHETFDHYGCLTPKGLDWCKRRYCDQHMFDFQ